MDKRGTRLSPLELLILQHLWEHPNTSARDLHDALDLKGPSTARTLLCRLTAQGLSRKTTQSRKIGADPRSTRWHFQIRPVSVFSLTAKGKEIMLRQTVQQLKEQR